MRKPGAVARRARVDRRRADLVLGAPLRGAGVRLLLLRDRHSSTRLSGSTGRIIAATFESQFESFAQRGSGSRSWAWSGPASLRSMPQIGHRPAQSGRHSSVVGSASASASRAQARRSRTPCSTYGESSSSPSPAARPPGRRPRRPAPPARGSACRARRGSPRSAAAARSHRRSCARCRGAPARAAARRDTLASERERVDRDVELKPAALAGAQPQTPEIESVSSQRHERSLARVQRAVTPREPDHSARVRLVSHLRLRRCLRRPVDRRLPAGRRRCRGMLEGRRRAHPEPRRGRASTGPASAGGRARAGRGRDRGAAVWR